MAFALLHNGTTSSPVVSGISAPIAVANPNEPTGEHLTLTTDPACALWKGVPMRFALYSAQSSVLLVCPAAAATDRAWEHQRTCASSGSRCSWLTRFACCCKPVGALPNLSGNWGKNSICSCSYAHAIVPPRDCMGPGASRQIYDLGAAQRAAPPPRRQMVISWTTRDAGSPVVQWTADATTLPYSPTARPGNHNLHAGRPVRRPGPEAGVLRPREPAERD